MITPLNKFIVEYVFQIVGRGGLVVGHVESGTLTRGMVHLTSGLKIDGIEFARRLNAPDATVLWFVGAPSKTQLEAKFAKGAVVHFE